MLDRRRPFALAGLLSLLGLLGLPFVGACDTTNNPDSSKPIEPFKYDSTGSVYDLDPDLLLPRYNQIVAAGYPEDDVGKFIVNFRYFALRNRNALAPASMPELWRGIDDLFDHVRAAAEGDPEEIRRLWVVQAEFYSVFETPRNAELNAKLYELALDTPGTIHDKIYWYFVNASDVDNQQLLGLCVGYRDAIGGQSVEFQDKFFAYCKKWSDGDFSLLWEGAADDYANLESDRLMEAEFRDFIATYVILGGACIYGDCAAGWTTRRASVKCADTNDGTGCLSIGWDASVAEGTVTSRCNGPFCPRSGWTSKGPSGTWTVTCKQDDCQETGFVLEKSKSKTRFEATCVQHCETVGYDLVGSDGSTWACRCGAGGCWETGIYCGMTQRPTAVEADKKKK